jgi:putative tricarboxylic transport membrane protein
MHRPAPARGEVLIALGVLALAALVYWQTAAIPVSPIYARVGPTVLPMICAGALALLGLALLISALRGGWQEDEERASVPDRAALGWIAAGLVGNVLLIGPAGFTVASVLLFACVARGFGSHQPGRDVAIGSFVAGSIGTLGTTFLAPVVVDLALHFGPADYFALMVLAFVSVAAVLGNSAVRGLTALFIGMILGPLAEQNFRQAMTISAGDWTVFLTRPLSGGLLLLAALALAGPALYRLRARGDDRSAA